MNISDEFMRFSDEDKRYVFQQVICRNFDILVFLLGYRDTGAFHIEQMERIGSVRLIKDSVRRLWLWSRGFFKTSLITEAHSIYLIINNPNIRILVNSYTLDVAKTMLKNIKEPFMTNEAFRYFFHLKRSDFCPQPNKEGKIEFGTTEEFTIPNRSVKYKEPTIKAAGIGTNLTGLHFDYMKNDDLVNEKSVTNDTQIEASKAYYSALRQLYDNPSIPREDVIGTIYHFNDLNSNLAKDLQFEKSFIPVHDKNEVYAFPERIDEKGFASIKNDPNMNPYDVQAQYLLNPLDPSKAKFKEEWLKEYVTLPEGLAEYITVDPASTQKKRSDYTVIERWGIDFEGKHYFIEGIRDKVKSFDRIDALFNMVGRSKNLKWVKYEVLGGRHGDLEVIKQKQIERKVFFEVRETKSSNASKTDRIEQRLCGPYNAGMILLPKQHIYRSKYDGKTHDFIQELRLEFLQFPFSEHDDILDCQSQMFEEMTIKGIKPRVTKSNKGVTADQWDEFYRSMDRERKLNPFITNEMVKKRLFARKFKRAMR